jgi:hypothetical protein
VGKITLICTVHRETGLCNEDELMRIFEAVSPEAIFEEIRPSDFNAYYGDRSKQTLETRTIGRYLKIRSARQVPVDEFVIPESLPRDMRILEDYLASHNMEDRALTDERDWKTCQYGFRYLNSPEFEALSKRSRESVEKTIALSGSEHLKSILSTWNEQLRRRESSMVENIYSFCRKNSFREGIFLVGAGHKSSIVEEIESHKKTEANIIDWKIWSGF